MNMIRVSGETLRDVYEPNDFLLTMKDGSPHLVCSKAKRNRIISTGLVAATKPIGKVNNDSMFEVRVS